MSLNALVAAGSEAAFVRRTPRASTRKSGVAPTLIALLLLTGCSTSLLCQTTAGSIIGRISDSQGAAIPGADVELVNEGTGATVRVHTNQEGDYVFASIPPGTFRIIAVSAGMQPHRIEHLILDVLQTRRQDITLAVGGGPAEVVTVTANTPVMQTDKPTISSLVDGRQIEETPLNGRSDVYQLMGLAPGVQRPNSNALIAGGSFTGGTTMTVDGIAMNDLFNARMAGTPPSLEDIAEFTVISNNASAEFGRGGAQVVLQTKSGSNEFHGSLFEFNRNRATQARNFFLSPTA